MVVLVLVQEGAGEAWWGGRIRRVRRSSTLHQQQLLTGLRLLTNCQGRRSHTTQSAPLHTHTHIQKCANTWMVPQNIKEKHYTAGKLLKRSFFPRIHLSLLGFQVLPVMCLHWLRDLLTGLEELFA